MDSSYQLHRGPFHLIFSYTTQRNNHFHESNQLDGTELNSQVNVVL